MKTLFVALLVLFFSLPALATNRAAYQAPCDDLWSAVKTTLGNQRDYAIVWIDDYRHKASFTVIGSLVMYTHKLELTPTPSGCLINANILQVGADDDDWRQLRKRVGKALANSQASKPRTTSEPPAE